MKGLPFPPLLQWYCPHFQILWVTHLLCSVSPISASPFLLLGSALPHTCLLWELIMSLCFSAYLQRKLLSKAVHTCIEISKSIIPEQWWSNILRYVRQSKWWFREVRIGLVRLVLGKQMPNEYLLIINIMIMMKWPSASLSGTFSIYIKRQKNLYVHQVPSWSYNSPVGKFTPLQAHKVFHLSFSWEIIFLMKQ